MAGKFKLQSVLNYRQSLEDQAQQLLTASLQKRAELETELAHQRSSLQSYDNQLRERQRDGLTVAEMDIFEAQIHHCRRLMAKLQTDLERLEEQIICQRNDLLQAARDRQVMGKLKEKQESEYRLELSRKERAMLDEISLRNKGENS